VLNAEDPSCYLHPSSLLSPLLTSPVPKAQQRSTCILLYLLLRVSEPYVYVPENGMLPPLSPVCCGRPAGGHYAQSTHSYVSVELQTATLEETPHRPAAKRGVCFPFFSSTWDPLSLDTTRDTVRPWMSEVRQAEFYTGSRGSSFVFLICMATHVSSYVAIVPCVCV
jgi:hypothetical protein